MAGMMDLLNTLIDGATVEQMSRQIGASEEQTQRAVSGALPMLVEALARNAGQPDGAQSLAAALDRDHDGSVLNDLTGFLTSASSAGGEGILGHVLGNRRPQVESGIGRMSGLEAGAVAKLLPLLAPIVMGALGKARREEKLDMNALSSALADERQQLERTQPDAMRTLGGLLDSDGDGKVMDDVAQLGSSLLGGLFKNG